jgi:CheY-like chemotaxis protein
LIYETACFGCKREFDAITAEWCDCLSTERTLVCPHCQNCFCEMPRSVRDNFWARAPKELWVRKVEMKRGSTTRSADEYVNPPVAALRRPAVLVVDDEPVIRAIASDTIRSMNYGLVVAHNGEEGLELAHIYAPELVLSDAFMPRLDGREMAKRIKAAPELNGTRIIIMTSLYTSAQHKHEALREFHVDEFVTKPLQIKRLRSLLQRMLG